MVPTSDVRREVAERLRFCARETNGTRDFAMFLNHWIGVGNVNVDGLFSVKSDRRTAEMTLETLADLIDPTCHVIPGKEAVAELKDGTRLTGVLLSCGHAVFGVSAKDMPRFCCECGARITNEVGDD